jgi:hypothetical protein
MSKLVGFGKFAALPEEQISERSTRRGFGQPCDSRYQPNDTQVLRRFIPAYLRRKSISGIGGIKHSAIRLCQGLDHASQ